MKAPSPPAVPLRLGRWRAQASVPPPEATLVGPPATRQQIYPQLLANSNCRHWKGIIVVDQPESKKVFFSCIEMIKLLIKFLQKYELFSFPNMILKSNTIMLKYCIVESTPKMMFLIKCFFVFNIY